jgi:hypothetical protein
MKTEFFAGLVLGASLLTAGLSAQATPITYNLADVTFADGTFATGSMTFDADTKKSSAFSIATTAGVLSAFKWSLSNSGLYYGGGAGPNNFTLITTDGRRVFNFSFLNPFTNAGGSNLINIASTYECNNCGTFRRVTGGSLTAVGAEVPEPASLALMLPAFGALAIARRRRKQAQA